MTGKRRIHRIRLRHVSLWMWPVALCFLVLGCASGRQAAGGLEKLLDPPEWPAAAARDAPALDTDALAHAIEDLVDRQRAARGIGPLAWAQRLADVAADHSRDMARHPFFGHVSPSETQPGDRARRAGLSVQYGGNGYLVEGIGENLFPTHRYREYQVDTATDGTKRFAFAWKTESELAREAVDMCLGSRAHRANLLSPAYRAAGIGVVHTDREVLFITQNFACRREAPLAAR